MPRIPDRLRLIGLACALALSFACRGGDGTEAGSAEVTDSAGVAVVQTSGGGIWGDSPPWSFEEGLRIGGISAPVEAQFGTISTAGGLAVASDGTIVILDTQARELRAFAADGSFLRTIAGPGEGPGELGQALSAVLIDGEDRIVVPDLLNQSLHRFNISGDHLGSLRLPAGGSGLGVFLPLRWGALQDGRIVAQVRALPFGPGGPLEMPAASSRPDFLIALDATGSPTDTVLEMPTGGTLRGLDPSGVMLEIFAPEPVWGPAPGGGVMTARTDAYRITVHGPDGSVERVLQRDVAPRPLSEADKEQLLDLMTAAVTEQAPEFAAFLDLSQMVSFADTYPLLIQLLPGPDGTIWVQATAEPSDAVSSMSGGMEGLAGGLEQLGGRMLAVFDADGRFLGELEMPERFRPMLWDGDSLFGIQTDELDVQSVLELRLVR